MQFLNFLGKFLYSVVTIFFFLIHVKKKHEECANIYKKNPFSPISGLLGKEVLFVEVICLCKLLTYTDKN